MAYRTVLLVVAEGVVVDSETNLVSLFNVLEEITPLGFPFLIPRLTVVATTQRDEGDPPVPADCSMRFLLDQDLLLEAPADINFRDRPRNRFKLTIGGLLIPRPGKLTVSLVVGGATLNSYAIAVRPAINPPAAAGGPAVPGAGPAQNPQNLG